METIDSRGLGEPKSRVKRLRLWLGSSAGYIKPTERQRRLCGHIRLKLDCLVADGIWGNWHIRTPCTDNYYKKVSRAESVVHGNGGGVWFVLGCLS